MKKMTEIDGIKVKTVPTVKSITYAEMDEGEQNRKNLEDTLVDMIVYYFKNKDK